MNKELMIAGKVPIVSSGILCFLAQHDVHRPRRTQSRGSTGNTMLCQPLSSLWGRQKERRVTECPPRSEAPGCSLLGVHSPFSTQMAHIWASQSSASPSQALLFRGSRVPILKEHSWLSPSCSSWKSKSEGSRLMVSLCY